MKVQPEMLFPEHSILPCAPCTHAFCLRLQHTVACKGVLGRSRTALQLFFRLEHGDVLYSLGQHSFACCNAFAGQQYQQHINRKYVYYKCKQTFTENYTQITEWVQLCLHACCLSAFPRGVQRCWIVEKHQQNTSSVLSGVYSPLQRKKTISGEA